MYNDELEAPSFAVGDNTPAITRLPDEELAAAPLWIQRQILSLYHTHSIVVDTTRFAKRRGRPLGSRTGRYTTRKAKPPKRMGKPPMMPPRLDGFLYLTDTLRNLSQGLAPPIITDLKMTKRDESHLERVVEATMLLTLVDRGHLVQEANLIMGWYIDRKYSHSQVTFARVYEALNPGRVNQERFGYIEAALSVKPALVMTPLEED